MTLHRNSVGQLRSSGLAYSSSQVMPNGQHSAGQLSFVYQTGITCLVHPSHVLIRPEQSDRIVFLSVGLHSLESVISSDSAEKNKHTV